MGTLLKGNNMNKDLDVEFERGLKNLSAAEFKKFSHLFQEYLLSLDEVGQERELSCHSKAV